MGKILPLFLAILTTQLSFANKSDSDRKTVEFFEELYGMKIEGVKPITEYDDPDSFYSAIAKQVGIPRMAFDAVEKEFGWKQSDEFRLTVWVRGGWD